jgi:hypothetical protein
MGVALTKLLLDLIHGVIFLGAAAADRVGPIQSTLVCFCGIETQHAAIGGKVGSRGGKIVECALRSLNDVTRNERSALFRSLLAAFQATLPLEDSPAIEVVLRKL